MADRTELHGKCRVVQSRAILNSPPPGCHKAERGVSPATPDKIVAGVHAMIGARETPAPTRIAINGDLRRPESPLRKELVLEQVNRVIASPLFRNSKRYTSLLKYVVEQRLENRAELLKERLLGIEVFGREADYDTNHDPVVRTSAVEIRKRLAQYYDDPAHRNEIRLTLPPGSYTPEFSIAEEETPALPEPVISPVFPRRRSLWRLASPVAIAGALLIFGIIHYFTAPSAVDEFWEPVRTAAAPVLFGVAGGPRPSASGSTLSDMFRSREDYVPFGDVSALVAVAGYMRAHGKPYRLQYLSAVTFQDLKNGPAVFIGPINRWAEQFVLGPRFSVQRDAAVTQTWIEDRQNPSSRTWSADVNALATSTAETYALVTRVRLEATRQILVSIAGLSPYATSAAGEVLADPQYLNEFSGRAPRQWASRNLQLVIATKRVGTTAGAPRIVDWHVW